MSKKLWDKGYEMDKDIEGFVTGDDYALDRDLLKYDCKASVAHAKMLGKVGVLSDSEVAGIVSELEHVIDLSGKGEFHILKGDEDCHTAIENHLVKNLGDTGKKIHTARSRNDQVLAALHLYYLNELEECECLVKELMKKLGKFSDKYGHIKLPGYTHMRKAMPSSVGLWSDAFVKSMDDNLKGLSLAKEIVNQSPLGTGAGYGIPMETDDDYVAKLLGFGKAMKNGIYAQNSRGKFAAHLLHTLSQVMHDINKTASDLMLFSMEEFGYFSMPDGLCTGSSIMPQKKNPDVLELLRAGYHVVVSNEFQVKSVSGNLMSGYNRDVQLTKKAVMEGFGITKECLEVTGIVIENLKVDEGRCNEGLTKGIYATERAYELVEKDGIPFREAYAIVAGK